MAGRPPKPYAEHVRDGTLQKCRHDDRLDKTPVEGDPKKPIWVRNDDYANECWDMVVQHSTHGVIGTIDTMALAAMCKWWSDFCNLLYSSAEEADNVTYHRREKAYKNFMDTAKEFGLTPAARGRMKMVAIEKGKDDSRRSELARMAGVPGMN